MITAKTYSDSIMYKVDFILNREDIYCDNWYIIIIQKSPVNINIAVKAYYKEEAIDLIADSNHYHLIECDEDQNDNTYYAGNNNLPVNLDHVSIQECGIDFFAKSYAMDVSNSILKKYRRK